MVAVALVAVTVQPVYATLRRRIERWVYGYRSDPAVALRRLGASLESADPLHVVEAITASVREALKVDRVWVAAPGRRRCPATRARSESRWSTGATSSAISSWRCRAGRRLSPADTALLHDLARQAAVTVRAAQLAGELQASRSRIVTAREEERKTTASRAPRRCRAIPGRDPAQARGRPVAQGRRGARRPAGGDP